MKNAGGRDMTAINGDKQVFFFSRGLGRGHAIPDAALAKELINLHSNLKVTFFSYGLGARTLSDLGCNVVDLQLPDMNPLWETAIRVVEIFSEHQPDLVVAHEEFAVVPIAKAFHLPCLFMTDWFAGPEMVMMQALKFADEILFLDDPGFMDEPPYLRDKTIYTGFIFRELDITGLNRGESRSKLGLMLDARVALVAPSGATIHTETAGPLFDLVIKAFDNLEIPKKQLVWVAADPDYSLVSEKVGGRDDVLMLKPHQDFPSTLIASDVVITSGNRITILECEALGIPSISLSYGRNPVDDLRVLRIPTNTPLRARSINSDQLGNYLLRALSNARNLRHKNTDWVCRGRLAAARRLSFHLQRASKGQSTDARPRL
jgi:hypothetical protein